MAKRRITGETRVPLHQRITEALAQDIVTGKYKPGQRFPSEAALVREFRVSRITAGRALAELARRGLVERIAGSGTYVRQRASARAVFGLLIPALGDTEIFEPMCRGLASAPQSADYALWWGHADPRSAIGAQEAVALCKQFVDGGVSGIFFAPLEGAPECRDANEQIVSVLSDARVPVVLLDRDYLPYPLRSGHDLAGIDNRRAGYMATKHLLDAGAKRVAFVGCASAASTVDARLAGYREALGRAMPLVFRPESVTSEAAAAFHKKARPDSYVCANDRTAGELMHSLIALGYEVPGNVRIVGIDDVEYASLLPAPLTTVRQPCREIGEAAMSAMIERIARPGMLARDILVECRLVVRASCGALRR